MSPPPTMWRTRSMRRAAWQMAPVCLPAPAARSMPARRAALWAGSRSSFEAWRRCMRQSAWLFLVMAVAGGISAASAQHQHAAPPPCAGADLACATAATPAFAADGRLWVAWSAGGQVMVARSADLGRSFAPAIAITRNPARIDNGPDARAKIAIDGNGRIYVAYAVFQDERYSGRVYLSRSTEGGGFPEPRPITEDATSQRFETLAVDPSGDLLVAWIDKRNAATARSEGKAYPGAALAFAWSKDGGTSFAPARIAQDQTCECCRLGIGFAGPHRPVVAFRNIFDGTTRDHAVTTFADASTPGPIHRVSVDNWKTNVCPHQGPALAIADGIYHVAWFTNGQARQGVFYARSADRGATFSPPIAIGTKYRAERPALIVQGHRVWLAWKEFDGEAMRVRLMVSVDDGVNWGAAETIASTTDASDQPLLVGDGRGVFLSWLTKKEGYRLLPLPGAS